MKKLLLFFLFGILTEYSFGQSSTSNSIDSILPNTIQRNFVKKILNRYKHLDDSVTVFVHDIRGGVAAEIIIKSKNSILLYNSVYTFSTKKHKVEILKSQGYIVSPFAFIDSFVSENIGNDTFSLMKIHGTICDGELYSFYYQNARSKKGYNFFCTEFLGGAKIPWTCLLFYLKSDKYWCEECKKY